MDIRITAKPVFSLPLNSSHIAALSVLSSHHYDSLCKSASKENGFLPRWALMVESNEKYRDEEDTEVATIPVSFHELDICLKILEGTGIAAQCKLLDNQDVALCRDLQCSFSGAAQLANGKFAEWQAVYSA